MLDSPASRTPYEVLGVSASASQEELRRAYRRLARETHPDMGGNAVRFHAVQIAWERVGDPVERAAYDRGLGPRTSERDAGPARSAPASARANSSSIRARVHGHPGGVARERFLALIREWVGRGTELADPYDPALLRSAPREIRAYLAKALAEEATVRAVSTLGIGFTIWSDVATDKGKLDHVVLGPSGLFALESADWGSVVRLHRGEVAGDDLDDDEEPVRSLSRRARSLGRSLGVRFTGLAIVVPDESLDEPVELIERGRHSGTVLIRRSVLPELLRNGLPGAPRTSIDRVFDVRTRLQTGIRFV
ncbi:J domain-containing protein [Compostimonas suwonensis]|uniref:Nuclease-like protein n=1 Tax=Compostimonas suwonensis TaxID=1048394 RepID=A0A2M9BB15_9MICO|nr:DnaJ domain-containing protein [Compostimonas suwonensis]PJJ55139.1 nuclease-like protein [Compostimonas suwonensis]